MDGGGKQRLFAAAHIRTDSLDKLLPILLGSPEKNAYLDIIIIICKFPI